MKFKKLGKLVEAERRAGERGRHERAYVDLDGMARRAKPGIADAPWMRERGYAVELLARGIRRLRIVCWKLGSRFIKLRILACVPGLLVQRAV